MFVYIYMCIYILDIYILDIYIYKLFYIYIIFTEGSLEVKFPTIWTWTNEKKSGKSQRREEKKKEEERRSKKRRPQKKEDPGARKGRKVTNTVFFQWVEAPEGRNVSSLKRRVRSQLARWEMKNCTPLWREAHFQVKMYKIPGVRTTFGSWDVEKVHAIVARSTFRSQNAQNTRGSDHFWKLRCRKSARRCGAKHISKSKCTKYQGNGPLLEVEMSKKCTPLWREAHFEVKMHKTPGVRTTFGSWDVEKAHAVVARSTFRSQKCKNWGARSTFWRSNVVSRGRRKGLCTLSKVSKTWGLCGLSTNDGRRGTFEEDFQRCIFRGSRQETCSSELLGGPGADFLRGVAFCLEHQIFRFAEMILRDRCSTLYDPASLFRGRRSSLDRWSQKIAKAFVRGRQLCTQLSIFEGSLAELLRFWCCQLKNAEVWQNCFGFDVVKRKNWGSLVELLRFWCCQVQKLRKSRRIASFSRLQIDR